jgi:glucan phosphoethanolaminetransferase (alkaline phosphatase superfamily)
MYRRSSFRGLAGGLAILAVALAFVFGNGSFNLPVFFVVLAFSILVGSLATLNPRRIYGALYGFFWMLILALFFITGSWIVFLLGAAISVILGSLARPLLAMLLGLGILGASNMAPQQPYYQPPQPQQPYQPYQPYQGGYTPQETYQEGERQQYPPQSQTQYQQPPQPQYDQPQAQYPQEMPPQQQ